MAQLAAGDRQRVIRMDAFPLHVTAVARKSAGHIHRKNGALSPVDHAEHGRQRRICRTAKADAKHGIHQHVRLGDQPFRRIILRQVEHLDLRTAELGKHERRIRILRRTEHQQHRHGKPVLGKLAGNDETVTAVFSLSA